MAQHQIAVIVGSVRKDSFNGKLAHALSRLAPSGFELKRLRIDDLPPYNQDDDRDQPAPTKRLKQEIAAAHGILFVTPEYNRSVPGVLKNAIDHASRPYGQSAFARPAHVAIRRLSRVRDGARCLLPSHPPVSTSGSANDDR